MIGQLKQAFQNLIVSIVTAAPKVVVGIILAILAVVVAKLIERAVRFVLTQVGFDALLGKIGLDKALQRLGVGPQLTIVLSRLTYYLVLMLLAKTAVDALGIAALSDALGAFFAYLPNLVAALLVLVLGSSISQFAGQAVTNSAHDSGVEFAPALGRAVSSIIFFVTAMMALAQLKFDTDMIRIVTSFALGGGALAFGLAFGLSARARTPVHFNCAPFSPLVTPESLPPASVPVKTRSTFMLSNCGGRLNLRLPSLNSICLIGRALPKRPTNRPVSLSPSRVISSQDE